MVLQEWWHSGPQPRPEAGTQLSGVLPRLSTPLVAPGHLSSPTQSHGHLPGMLGPRKGHGLCSPPWSLQSRGHVLGLCSVGTTRLAPLTLPTLQGDRKRTGQHSHSAGGKQDLLSPQRETRLGFGKWPPWKARRGVTPGRQ